MKERVTRASPSRISTPPKIKLLLAGQPSFSKALIASVRMLWEQVSKPEYRPEVYTTIRF